ncbi:MAG: chloride channel protein [Acidimicrobiales bacterium]
MRRPQFRVDRRAQGVLAASAATGVAVGVVVAGFERVTDALLLDAVLSRPAWVQALGPGLGLVVAALALRWLAAGATPATTDEYVANFHDRRRLALRPVVGRVVAGIATIGTGGAMGLEGPSIYAGASVGSALQRRLSQVFRRDEAKVLLVAGAAAGVAAVFKAPATGVVFAIEVPYTDDVARRALIPSLLASATSYLTFVSLVDPRPLFPLVGVGSGFELSDLGGALALGLLAGGLARLFSILVHRAKDVAYRWPAWRRVALGAIALAALVLLTRAVFDHPLSLGPGYEVIAWAAEGDQTRTAIALLFAVRVAATVVTLGAGGAGGLFIPLAVQGVLLGRFVSTLVGEEGSSLFPVIGIAAFLGAGYRTPVASVMFVAETTGRAVFVVPALVAAAVSQLVMGRESVSSTQQSVRSGHLERRFRLPITTALTTDVLTVPPDATAAEFVWVHLVGRRERAVAVVEDGRYLGMCLIEVVSELPREAWEATPVTEVMRTDLPVARPTWTLRDAVVAMESADVERLAVVDANDAFIGVVLTSEIVKLDEILEETGG